MRVFLFVALALLSVIPAQANGKKQPPLSITFHLVSTNQESKKLSIPVDTPQGRRFIQRSPFVSTADIIAYHPFESPHNPDMYGVTLQLSKLGSRRLRAVTGENLGTWVVASINGNVVDMLKIDKQVDGRVITIWRGIDAATLGICDSLVPRIGESKEAWEKRRKIIEKRKKQ
ncbi:hypothetical protein SAMN02745181_2768 [Rubritalea squalenifaciens DSM 18772]|uniref:Uncharacterized protein n=2 Tax=Rubritalea TaxID=361050 RepID=A0A1M6N805_9BACT|nr:hypothetical protein [Rubritalea squalenifaciens]SHJ91821.1 hypothetical protein SAMN02745181_2768 [Rubritalea squalenifaciens DSM 18772]